MTDATGSVIWRAVYDPFGAAIVDEDVDGDGLHVGLNLRFPGQYYDEETKNYYNYFRDYDPATGRYIQSDPIGLKGGINTYAYVLQDPINWVDTDGLSRGARRGGGNPRSPGVGSYGGRGTWHSGRFYPSMGESIPRLPAPPSYPMLPAPRNRDSLECNFVPTEHWESFRGHAPLRSTPFDVIPRYNSDGTFRGATTYDALGNRSHQYEFGSGVRHGEGYHTYGNSGGYGGYGNGPRSDHINF
jgi:RHS repeat-associated protein